MIEPAIERPTGIALHARERGDLRTSTPLGQRVIEPHEVTEVTTVLKP